MGCQPPKLKDIVKAYGKSNWMHALWQSNSIMSNALIGTVRAVIVVYMLGVHQWKNCTCTELVFKKKKKKRKKNHPLGKSQKVSQISLLCKKRHQKVEQYLVGNCQMVLVTL